MTHDLSEYGEHFGILTDAEIAERSGVHINTIAAWRRRAGCSNATTLGEPSRPFQLRMTVSLMECIRQVDAARVAAGRKSNYSQVIRDAVGAGLPLLDET